MKKLILATTILALSASAAFAAVTSYQVTGPVLALSDSSITVQKGTEKWELARDGSTKLPDSVKVGSKVTIHYTMTAGIVEDKGGAKPDAAKKDDKATPAKDPKAAAKK